MSPVANSERQRRFRELTMKDRQLKADILDLLLAAIEAEQEITIPLPDGRQLKVERRKGEARVQIVENAKMQSDIARARFRRLYGE
jgi:hypothetical protein